MKGIFSMLIRVFVLTRRDAMAKRQVSNLETVPISTTSWLTE